MTTKKTTKKTVKKTTKPSIPVKDGIMYDEPEPLSAEIIALLNAKKAREEKSQTIKELTDMVSLRNHIYTLVNGPRTQLISRDEEQKLRTFANQLDREVVDKSLEMVIVDKPVPAKKVVHEAMAQANAVKAEEKVRPRGSFRRVTD